METLPTVVVDAPFEGKTTSSVMVDHQKAQYEITKKMILDHEIVDKVLYLAGRRDGFVTDLRLQGVVDASVELDVELDARYSDFSEKKAFELTKKYGEQSNLIVCASDLMAIGAFSALSSMDVFRPVCGFDGITLLGYIDYKIMTVKQDFYTVSKTAIDEILHLTQGEKGRSVVMDYKITQINYEDVIM